MRRKGLTGRLVREMKPDLVRAHDSGQVELVVNLSHGEPVPVLHGAVAECEADHLAELLRVDGNNDLGQDDGLQPFQPRACGCLRHSKSAPEY
jgi:hypothetical protein